MAWTYNPNEYEEQGFQLVPAGDHRVRISEVSERTFSSGNSGYEIILDVSGYGSKLWYYLVLDPSDSKKTNQRIGSFFNSFGITDYDMSHFAGWKGKLGAVRVVHEEYNGEQQAKVRFCLARKNQDKLPPWKGNASTPAPAVGNYAAVDIPDSELPFV